MERMEECEEEGEQEMQKKELQEKETAQEMGKWGVDRLGETRKRAGVSDKDGGAPHDKHKKSGEIVEVLKESIKATKKKGDKKES